MDLSVRNRTIRKTHESESPLASQLSYSPQSSTLESFLDSNASEAYRRPWHRLEWGLRVNRIRRFIEKEKQLHSLTESDSIDLTNLLLRCLKLKKLNSKTTVVYDLEEEEIKEIKGLHYHTSANGSVKAEFTEKKGAVTMRRRGATSPAPSPADGGGVAELSKK
jgi:hypothetical protein